MRPIEYISFKNGTDLYRFTDSNIVEQLGGRTFTPLAYTRSEPSQSKDSNDTQIEIEVPGSLQLVTAFGQVPSSFTTTVTIERADRDIPGSERVYWQGVVVSINREGQFATILAAPINALPSQVPRYTYSALCNWALFADRCGLARNNFRHIGPVASIEDETTFTITDLRNQAVALDAANGSQLTSGEIDLYWLAGYVENGAGEKRPIFEGNVDGVPDRIRILRPFNSLAASDQVTVYAGCSRTRDICKRKFANQSRHGGFPDIPTVNAFRTELPPGGVGAEKRGFFLGNK